VRRVAVVAVVAGVVAGVLWYLLVGAPPGWAVGLAVPVAGVAALLAGAPRAGEPTWQPLPAPPGGPAELRASVLASRLAEAALDGDRFRTRVRPRLVALALARLRHRHPDLASVADPRARALLGDELHGLLTDRDARLPDPGRLADLLHRLEEL
jgi:hypothetical protein